MDSQDARNRAEQLAIQELQACGVATGADVLSTEALEAEGCWIFFLSDSALGRVRESPGRLVFKAFAVSKAGDASSVYDFREQPEKMNAYLQLWSLQSLGRRKQAKIALDSFLMKYGQGDGGDAA